MDIKKSNNQAIRAGILKAMKSTNTSAYRICKDLEINQSNFSAYRHGKNTISGKVLSKVMQYLKIN